MQAGSAKIIVENTQLVAGDGDGTVIDSTLFNDGTAIISVYGADSGVISAKAEISIITDTDGDGDVDLADISIFMAAWFRKDKTFDFNGDGRMTFVDFSILLAESFFK